MSYTIGGSEIAGVLNKSVYGTTPLAIYNRVMGLTEPKQDNNFMEWGRRIEPLLLDKYEEITGFEVTRAPEKITEGYFRASLDGWCDENHHVIEAKTTTYFDNKWGETGSEEVPYDYYLQVHQYMLLTGASQADIIALSMATRECRLFNIKYDREIGAEIVTGVREFMENHVLKGIPPEDALKEFAKDKTVIASVDIESMVSKLRLLEAQTNPAKREIEALKKQIMQYMAGNEFLVNEGGKPLCVLKEVERAAYTVKASKYQMLKCVGE